eukprot:3614018-Amphidinium_carterae.1
MALMTVPMLPRPSILTNTKSSFCGRWSDFGIAGCLRSLSMAGFSLPDAELSRLSPEEYFAPKEDREESMTMVCMRSAIFKTWRISWGDVGSVWHLSQIELSCEHNRHHITKPRDRAPRHIKPQDHHNHKTNIYECQVATQKKSCKRGRMKTQPEEMASKTLLQKSSVNFFEGKTYSPTNNY